MARLSRLAISCLLSVAITAMVRGADDQASAAEQRAVAYLSQEVPSWPRQNNCFSCHNNGDAARALYVARAMSHTVPAEALADTTSWLKQPLAWNEAKGDPGFSDLKLARIQFAAALTEAVQTGAIRERDALAAAAEGLVKDQETDGSWDVDVPGVVGSPATYGDALGTYMARRTLEAASVARFEEAIARADAWFLTAKPTATVDVAAVALALAARVDQLEQPPAPGATAGAARAKLHEIIERILASQSSDGGWGPYPKSPSEPFDTAVTLLALNASNDLGLAGSNAVPAVIAQGRAYLIRAQLPAGGWPETTRPSGFQSYAHHISTSGWATLALLRTREVAAR